VVVVFANEAAEVCANVPGVCDGLSTCSSGVCANLSIAGCQELSNLLVLIIGVSAQVLLGVCSLVGLGPV